jgi:hypothetical protein
MDKYLKNIDKQIEFNQGKNIFLDDNDTTLKFVDETIKAISGINELNIDAEKLLIDYATDKALEEFCRINQYYTFDSQAKNDLRRIYRDLFSNIKTNENSIETISKNHYQNLKQWLRKTNPFAEKIYSNADFDISPVACSEYKPDLQINVLKIDTRTLMEPVLDIGCGKQGNLVNYLCELGIETCGIDRFLFTANNLTNSDWLEYNYGTEKWGTLISNLGFSNHFKHHNLRADGNYIEYGKKYMDILKSLKIGGRFHYAPDLPFIEQYLDNRQFEIEKNEVGEYDFKATIITRLE